MTALPQSFPLDAYRRRVAEYVGGLSLPYTSLAGSIIASRLRAAPARDDSALVVWACAAVGGDPDDAAGAAAAVALFGHAAALRAEVLRGALPEGLGQGINAHDALNAVAYRVLLAGTAPLARRLDASRAIVAAYIASIERADDALVWGGIEAGALLGGASPALARRLRAAGRWLAAVGGPPAAAYAERAVHVVAASGIAHAHVSAFASVAADAVARA